MDSIQNLKMTTFLSEDQIQSRIRSMGAEITKAFQGKDLVAVGVLKGSFMFYADLIRELDLDLSCEFCGVSSYHGGTSSSGEVRVTLDLNSPIQGRHLLLIEDIVDTGLTMQFLKQHFAARKPASITTAALLFKPHALKVECELDHVGFEIPNDFVVGYGLDYQGYFRNLPYIAQINNLN